MPYVLMKLFEEAPRRFDAWMQLLTFGRLQKIREEIATSAIGPGAHVLEIGCGPGTFVNMLSQRGVRVTAIDTSAEMLEAAQESLNGDPGGGQVEFKRLSALEIEDSFARETFDHVIGILVFSELADQEIDCVFQQCRDVLKPGGRLIVVDEVEPRQALRRWFFRILRFPLRLITFLVLQAKDLETGNLLKKVLYYVIEFPLMLLTFLVVPPASHPLSNLEQRLRAAGLATTGSKRFLAGTLELQQAKRVA
jgi:ubiquinone/menaquinone biosynthesis C-methylase UbiE